MRAVLAELAFGLLLEGKSIRFRCTGGSMGPTINHGEVVMVCPSDAQHVGVGQVVLACVGGRLLAHRVVDIDHATDEQMFALRGDSQRSGAIVVGARQIIGRVVTLERQGKARLISSSPPHAVVGAFRRLERRLRSALLRSLECWDVRQRSADASI